MSKSEIGWTDEVWNPVTGCTRVSAGCDHCYASALHNKRYRANVQAALKYDKDEAEQWFRVPGLTIPQDFRRNGDWAASLLPFPDTYDTPFAVVKLHPERLEAPLRWQKPRRIFVNSMSDLFHEDVPDEFIVKVYGVMVAAYWHVMQILTKRPERRLALLTNAAFRDQVALVAAAHTNKLRGRDPLGRHPTASYSATVNMAKWLEGAAANIHEGTSAENQEQADKRLPITLETPAAARFVSLEPMLGRVDLTQWIGGDDGRGEATRKRRIRGSAGGGVDDRRTRPGMASGSAAGRSMERGNASAPVHATPCGESSGPVSTGAGNGELEEGPRAGPPAGMAPLLRPNPSGDDDQSQRRDQDPQRADQSRTGDGVGAGVTQRTRPWASPGTQLSWVIVGGESGAKRRDCGVEAIVDVVRQCEAAGVPCWVKQDSSFRPGQQGRIPDDIWARKDFPR